MNMLALFVVLGFALSILLCLFWVSYVQVSIHIHVQLYYCTNCYSKPFLKQKGRKKLLGL